MKQRGFTLIEMMSVVLIIALLSIAVVPSILKQVANEKEGINNQTKNLITSAADLFVSRHKTSFENVIHSGDAYIDIQQLIDADLLDQSITTEGNVNAVSSETCITVKLVELEYEYTIVQNPSDECSETVTN